MLAAGGEAIIHVDAGKPVRAINPGMFGIFVEEINLGVDGGLYPEMIRNRGFENAKPPEGYERSADGRWRNHSPGGGGDSGWEETVEGGLPYWSLVREGAAQGGIHLDLDNPLNAINPRSLRLEIDNPEGRIGFANSGFYGVDCESGGKYKLSFFARSDDNFNGELTVAIESKDGKASNTEPVAIKGIGRDWKKHEVMLTGKRTDHDGRFVITASAKGRLWFDMVSLFPAKTFMNRPNGLRQDIAQLLADLKPGFVRFPGGCVVEGGSIKTAYDWQKTVGPLEQREEIWGTWGYRRTHGMGFAEYFQFCEDIKARPLPVLFGGESCGYRSWELVPVEENPWVTAKYLDLIEFANGPADGKWGKVRAAGGHPAPYQMDMVEIGNENGGPGYTAHYPLIFKGIKDKYPDMKTIACSGRPNPNGPVAEMVDDHYYNNAYWFMHNETLYDKRDRTQPPVYVGEGACNSDECGPNGNLFGALAEAIFYMGMENNGDVVRMASYAPLLCNVNYKRWPRNLIYFDNHRIFAQPSYYAQKMLMNNTPDQTLAVTTEANIKDDAKLNFMFRILAPGSKLEIKDINAIHDGKSILPSAFSPDSRDWTKEGEWSVRDGVISNKEGGVIKCNVAGGVNDYTLSLKVRKMGGNPAEGLWLFFAQGTGNGEVQLSMGGRDRQGSSIFGLGIQDGKDAKFDLGQWYDVRIVVKGAKIRVFVDDQLRHDVSAPSTARFVVFAGRDSKTGEIILKAVNTSGETIKAAIDLQGAAAVNPIGSVTCMQGKTITEENTFENPTHVVDKTEPLNGVSNKFNHSFPPYSFTAIRVKAKAR